MTAIELYSTNIQKYAINRYFPKVLFIKLHKAVLTFCVSGRNPEVPFKVLLLVLYTESSFVMYLTRWDPQS